MFQFDYFVKIGCKVTQFYSITQTFLQKTDFCVHTQGTIVQVLPFFLVFFTLYVTFATQYPMEKLPPAYTSTTSIFDYILAFCFSPAPEPRYFDRASLNFQVRSSTKVRRAGLCVVSSR